MYQLQVDPNISLPPITSPLAKPPAFFPPKYAIWVNSLWFLSLVISLTCAMLATLLQQWARRYVRTTQVLRCSPKKRARMRAYFANGVDKFHVTWAVETLPTLVHLSLLMFFAGLLIYLFNINHTVFSIVVCWVGLTSAAYVCITLMPIFWHDSPFYTPLSSTILVLYAAIPYALFKLLDRIAFRYKLSYAVRFRYYLLWWRYHDLVSGGIGKAAEVTASKQSLETDSRILGWIVDVLHQDNELEKFLGIIPDFFNSHVTGNLKTALASAVHEKIEDAAGNFLVRILSSSFVPDSVTSRRLVTCLDAADVVGGLSLVAGVLGRVGNLSRNWQGAPQSVEIGHFLRHWVSSHYGENIVEVQCIIASIISSVKECDSRWMALTLDQLGVPEQVLGYYLTHGNSVLLANLIHILRQILRSDSAVVPRTAMELISEFDVQDALPGLQHDFCALWNEVVEECRKSRGSNSVLLAILSSTRNIYIALHSGTDAAPTAFSTSTDHYAMVLYQSSSYPLCSIPDHLSIPHAHDSGTGEFAHAPAITHPTDPHQDPTSVPIIPSPPPGTDIPSFPTSDQGPATPNTTDESSLGDMLPSITTSPHHDLQVPSVGTVTSLDQVIPITTQVAGRRLTTSLTSDSDLRSTPVAPLYIPQPALTHLSGITSIVSGQRNEDYHDTSPGPSTPPDTSISSRLLLPPPGHTPSVILKPFTATSASLSDQNRATASPIDPQEASDSGPHVE